MTRGIIAAVSPEGIIGVGGRIPWHYSADLKRFKRLTMGATVVMGRLTWESLPQKPLAGRRNIVVTSRKLEGVECFPTLAEALDACEGDVWFIGGARIYDEAMGYADVIDLALVPDRIEAKDAVYFPNIDPGVWEAGPVETDPHDPRLKHRIYRKQRRDKVTESRRHEFVSAPELPKPVGPYSPGVRLGDLVFVSGQGGVDPETGKLADGVEAQTEQVFKNVEAILKAAGSSLQNVVRCGVFLADMGEFSKMNAVYERMMAGNRPARTTIQAAALPLGLLVEIDVIAYRSTEA
ncbi:MAG TPA: Rid family detoxifying hydrolase [Vicinamibacteria bacterium]|nr:Rid family detoxifying hydrolase [Vicinamibacteria bacterium]